MLRVNLISALSCLTLPPLPPSQNKDLRQARALLPLGSLSQKNTHPPERPHRRYSNQCTPLSCPHRSSQPSLHLTVTLVSKHVYNVHVPRRKSTARQIPNLPRFGMQTIGLSPLARSQLSLGGHRMVIRTLAAAAASKSCLKQTSFSPAPHLSFQLFC